MENKSNSIFDEPIIIKKGIEYKERMHLTEGQDYCISLRDGTHFIARFIREAPNCLCFQGELGNGIRLNPLFITKTEAIKK